MRTLTSLAWEYDGMFREKHLLVMANLCIYVFRRKGISNFPAYLTVDVRRFSDA